MPEKKPEIIVFAGPNGSGKSTITQFAKKVGYFIRCIYVLTADPQINIHRVKVRHDNGGHFVPEDKIRTRYDRCLALIPEIISVCDIFHLYDNTTTPFRIFKKRKSENFIWENEFWSREKIEKLTKCVE